MHPLFLLFSLPLPSVFATLLAVSPAQLLTLNPLTSTSPPPTTNATNLGAEIGCFKNTKIPPFIATNKADCEDALDDWVRGQSLIQPRAFSRKPSASSTIDDVLLPLEKVSGSCGIYVDVIDEEDEDTLTLAEIYAELLGPDGVMKQCLGQVRLPAIGGRMSFGEKGLVKIVVTGREVGGVGAES